MGRLKATEKAYIAGLIDGEGCLRIEFDKRNNCGNPLIQITNNNREVLEWCKEALGCGEIYKNESKAFVYRLRKKDVLRVLLAIKNHLIIKRRHADVLLAFTKCRIKKRKVPILDEKTGRIKGSLPNPLDPLELKCLQQLKELNRLRGSSGTVMGIFVGQKT